MTTELGTVYRVDPLEVFTGGNGPLAQWLAKHLDVVGAALGMDLEATADRGSASGAADVVARDVNRDRTVIFCSQVTRSDENQLGRLITLAGDNAAHAVVWVGAELREVHRQALEWFNRHAAPDGIKFYALGLELFRVDDSKPGVVLRLIEAPAERNNGAGAVRANRNGILSASGAIGIAESNGDARVKAGDEGIAPRPETALGEAVSDDILQVPATVLEDAAAAAAAAAPDGKDGKDQRDATGSPASADGDTGRKAGEPAAPAADQQEAYRKFFQRVVDELREKFGVNGAKEAQPQNWYSLASGVSGIIYSIWFSTNGRIRAELYIDVGDRDTNREIFERMQSHAAEIQKEYGSKLEWDATQGGRAYSVSTSVPGKIDDPPATLEKNLKWTIGRMGMFRDVFGRRLPVVVRSIPPKQAPAQRQYAPAPNR